MAENKIKCYLVVIDHRKGPVVKYQAVNYGSFCKVKFPSYVKEFREIPGFKPALKVAIDWAIRNLEDFQPEKQVLTIQGR